MRFVAVSGCPTGIAHTQMAAEALEQAAAAVGHERTVETQGAVGSTPLGPAAIVRRGRRRHGRRCVDGMDRRRLHGRFAAVVGAPGVLDRHVGVRLRSG